MQTNCKEQGSALLEALIGILIFSMGILAIIGLQAASVKNTADAKDRTEASFYSNQILGKMWVDQSNLASYIVTDQAISGLPNGKRTVTVNGTLVTITITWQPPGSAATHRYVAAAEITH